MCVCVCVRARASDLALSNLVRHFLQLVNFFVWIFAAEIHIDGATYVEKSSVIRLVCNATGEEHSPDDIDWFLNGQKLVTDYANQVS